MASAFDTHLTTCGQCRDHPFNLCAAGEVLLRLSAAPAPPGETPAPPARSAREFTHFCEWDEPGRRSVRALCGTYIRRTGHASEPTCPECRRVRAYNNAMRVE